MASFGAWINNKLVDMVRRKEADDAKIKEQDLQKCSNKISM